MVLAEYPNFPLASRCNEVRSNSAGLALVDGAEVSLTVADWSRTASTIFCACATSHRRSGFCSVSRPSPSAVGGRFQFSSNHLPTYSPCVTLKVAWISQYGRLTNLRMASSRTTTTDRVGVCTRPTVVKKKPPSRELNAVMARVPLIPTNQSASDRQRAASASGCICSSERKFTNPSRMACGVMDCSHKRRAGLPNGFFSLANCSMSLKISSPSRPASHALIRRSMSFRFASFTTAFKRDLVFSMGRRSKCGGKTGRLLKLHLPRFTSNASGAAISTRCPTAEVTTYCSFSKASSDF